MLVTSKECVQGIFESGNRAPWARCESGCVVDFLFEVLQPFQNNDAYNDVRFDIHRQILVQFSQVAGYLY